MALCVEDIDCDPIGTNRLCYANLSRFDGELDAQGCACNTFYGWSGDNCDEFTWSTYFTMIVMGTTAVLTGYTTVQMVRLFILSYKYEELWTAKFYTIILLTGGCFGLWGWTSMIFLSTVTVGGGAILVDPDKYADPYFGRWNFPSLFFGPIGVFGCALAVVNIAVVWLNLAFRTHNLDRSQTRSYKYNRRFLIGFEVSVIVMALGAFGYEKLNPDGTSVWGFAVSIPILAVAIWYILGYNKFMPILQAASVFQKDRMIDITRVIIRKTMRRIIFGLILYFIAVFVNSSLDTLGGSWKNFTSEGRVGPGKLFHHLQPVSIAFMAFSVYRYLLVFSTNGDFYVIVGCCNPEMIENSQFVPETEKHSEKTSLGVTTRIPPTDKKTGTDPDPEI